ncbi:MAG TPA: histidine kinase, partial [Actinomycetota bacterium]
MTDRSARRLAWTVFGLDVAVIAGAVALSLATPRNPNGGVNNALFSVLTQTFTVVGIIILARQPRNTTGWILMGIGIAWTGLGLGDYGDFAIARGLPGGAVATALSAPLWAPPIALMGTFLILRFPDGRLLSPRWKKVEWLSAIAIAVVVLAIIVSPGPLSDEGYPHLNNPLGIEALKPFFPVFIPFLLLIPGTIVASAVSLIRRFRRSRGTERLQLKWLTSAAAVVATLYLIAMLFSISVTWDTPATPTWLRVIQNAAIGSFVLIPIAIGFAVLKYRLYDIDVVINKTLVYGSMAAFITAVYVAIVVGIGHAIGSQRNLGLSILATAMVAVGFQPVRERIQRFANRLVYGKRATPYEVLAEFSGGMSHAVATEELLPRMARIVAEGTGAAEVHVWLRVGSELIREASWPQTNGTSPAMTAALRGGDLSVDGSDASVPVRHQGELLGAIALKKSPGDPVKPAESKLLENLSSQAGLVLRNVRLIEDLRTSRQRLVTAQDEERRRLERDLHDGAQQRLVAIALILRLARGQVDPAADPELAKRIDAAAEQMAMALSELREFARGIHPAILTERGLVPALQSLAERSTVPATVESSLEARLPAAVEATAYFVVSEALANVGKYSKASAVAVVVEEADGLLSLEVSDDGVGGA